MIGALLLIFLLSLSGWSEAPAALPPDSRTTVELTCRGSYDSNLLHYSTRDRERFLDQTEPHPSPIRSLDDWRTDFKVNAAWQFRELSLGGSELRAVADFAQHAMNPIKNLGWLSLTAAQDFGGDWNAALGYFYEPGFYIRDYRDMHSNEFHRAKFSLNQWSGRLRWRPVKWGELNCSGKSKQYFYNGYFTEYDGRAGEGGLESVYRSRDWRFSMGWTYSEFNNTGFNSVDRLPPGLNLEDNDAGDGDWREDELTASARRTLRIKDQKVFVGSHLTWSSRYYTTQQPPEIDPIHHGRRDVSYTLDLFIQSPITERVLLESGVETGRRRTKAADPIVSEVKNYNRWGYWLELAYQLR